jgi:hypothetical protein
MKQEDFSGGANYHPRWGVSIPRQDFICVRFDSSGSPLNSLPAMMRGRRLLLRFYLFNLGHLDRFARLALFQRSGSFDGFAHHA